MKNQELMRLFQFTESDLKHNQSGTFSPGQERRLTTSRRTVKVLLLVMVAACAAWIFSFARQLMSKPLPTTQTVIYTLATIVLVVIAGWLLLQLRRRPDNTVAKVRGPVQLVRYESTATDSTQGMIIHEMWVGSERFIIEKHIFANLVDDQEMIVYYTPDTLRILSAEILETEAVAVQ